MTMMLDLDPPARQLMTLVKGVSDDQLPDPTPCEGTTVSDLLHHLLGLTVAFRIAANKEAASYGRGSDAPQEPGVRPAGALDSDWRSRLTEQLEDLVAAWRQPDAWEGSTEAGGVTLPGAVAGIVALDELVLHGWDLARATGQPFACDPVSTQAVFEFTTQSSRPEEQELREGLFGPVVEVPPDAPLFDRALGLSGRDPSWTP